MSETTESSDFSNLYTPIARYQGNGSSLTFDLDELVPEGDQRLAVTVDGQEIASSLYELNQKEGTEEETVSYISFTTAPSNGSYLVVFRRIFPKISNNLAPTHPVHTRHIADGVKRKFSFSFAIQSKKDAVVFVDGVEGKQDYALEKKQAGGTVTFTEIPKNGQEIIILRRFAPTRLGRFHPSGLLDAESLNKELDRLFFIAQDIELRQLYALHFDYQEETVPTKIAARTKRQNTLLGFDQEGDITLLPSVTAGGIVQARYHHITDALTSSDDSGIIASFSFSPTQSMPVLLLQANIALSLRGTLSDFPFYWSWDDENKNRDGLILHAQTGRSALLSLHALLPLSDKTSGCLKIAWDFSNLSKPSNWRVIRNPEQNTIREKSMVLISELGTGEDA